jgi:hypothetical protein
VEDVWKMCECCVHEVEMMCAIGVFDVCRLYVGPAGCVKGAWRACG